MEKASLITNALLTVLLVLNIASVYFLSQIKTSMEKR